MSKVKMCGSCRRGDIHDVEADFYVEGRRQIQTRTGVTRNQFFRTYVCSDHLYCLEQDGDTITRKKKLGSNVKGVRINC